MLVERLTAQLLAGPPARGPAAVCERLLAVQGQDPRGFRLAVRARTEGVAASDVDRALDARELVVTWLNRGTLHLVRSEDLPWLHALTAPRHVTQILRRLGQVGVSDPEAGVAVIERALADEGPLTRDELAARLSGSGVRSAGQATYQLLALTAARGSIVRGPLRGRHHGYVLVHDWLGPPARVDREAALAELARRYLAGHGPATDRDLARWAGLPLRDVRAGLAAIAPELVVREDGAVVLASAPEPAPLPAPRLLGAFEPVLLGWDSRADIVGAHPGEVTMQGIFRSFAMVSGRAVATWGLAGGKVSIAPLEPVADRDLRALEADAEAVRRFLET